MRGRGAGRNEPGGYRVALLRFVPQSPPAARASAAHQRSAAPRRAAVHPDPSGVRAVVQADAARARRRGAIPRRRRLAQGRQGVPPHPRDPARPAAAGRHPRDDDAAGLQRLSLRAQPRERLSVGAVSRDRVPLRAGRRREVPAPPRAHAGGARAARKAHARAHAVRRAQSVPHAARLRRDLARRARRRVPHDLRARGAALQPLPAARGPHRLRRGRAAVALAARGDGRAHDRHEAGHGRDAGRRVLADDAAPPLLPRAVGSAHGPRELVRVIAATTARARDRFAGIDVNTWLVSHSMGAPPLAARDALVRYHAQWADGGPEGAWPAWLDEARAIADGIGEIVGAPAGSVALGPNPRTLPALLASALAWA